MNTLKYLQSNEFLLDVDLWRIFANLEELNKVRRKREVLLRWEINQKKTTNQKLLFHFSGHIWNFVHVIHLFFLSLWDISESQISPAQIILLYLQPKIHDILNMGRAHLAVVSEVNRSLRVILISRSLSKGFVERNYSANLQQTSKHSKITT